MKPSGYLSGSANVQFKTPKYRYMHHTAKEHRDAAAWPVEA